MRLKLLLAFVLFCPATRALAQPAEVQMYSAVFSLDLQLDESKSFVHRVWLKCPLADGGKGKLTFDPNVLKFDAFGDPVAGGNPILLVNLDFSLKLIKKEMS